MNKDRLFRRIYQQQFDNLKSSVIETPPQGWVKTMRKFMGMTQEQLAEKMGCEPVFISRIENNKTNPTIKTMEKIADALGCEFYYGFLPRKSYEDIFYEQATKKAKKILEKINQNMGLENQTPNQELLLNEITEELLNGKISKIWEDDI